MILSSLYLYFLTTLVFPFCWVFLGFGFCLFGRTAQHAELPRPGIQPMPRPLQWKRGVLTTGPPGKSISVEFLNLFIVDLYELFILNRFPMLFLITHNGNIVSQSLACVFTLLMVSFEDFQSTIVKYVNLCLIVCASCLLRNSPLSQGDKVFSSFCFIFHYKL